ncbi:hypothetical protein FJT64_002526 [Amphibalanus amphitrite]|uniref:Uncharacterized protein n=1 Tax=Amphibalanus amphitrite TaxID=1232801 RepID=A0A6A4WE58_AMPAM|nr:hypothetical protein FJT64_002526 [Amphibalanus amphitrite]
MLSSTYPFRSRVVAVNACRTAPEGSAGRLLSLLDQLRLPDAGALPDWGLHPGKRSQGVSPDGAAGYRDGLRRDHQRPPALRRGGTEGRQPGEPALQLAAQRVVAVNACRTAPEGSAGRLLSLLDQLRLPDAGALPDWGLHPAETLVGLQNLLVHLRDVSAENAHVYQYRLWDAKRVKVETAQNRGVSPDGAAGYRDGLRRDHQRPPALRRGGTEGRQPGEPALQLAAQRVVAVNACRTAPEGSAGRLLSLLDQLRLPDAGALPDWGLHPAETLVGLQNLLVHLRDVSAENAHVYQYRLWDAKRVKVETAQNRGVSPDGAAGYRDGLRRDHQRPPALRRGGTEGRQPGEPALQLAAQRVVAVNACRTAPEGSAGRLLSLLDQLRLPDAGALPDWGLHPAETLVGLQNLLVHLRDVSAENAHVYQYRLWDAKRVKVETAQNRGVSPDGAAGYRDGLRRDHQRPPALRRGGTEGRQPGEPALQLAAQRVVAVNACRTAPEGSAGRLLSLLDQLRLPDAGALPDWGLHPAETLVGLQNLLVHLRDVSAENAHVYQYRLWDAKRVKVETAQNRGVSPDGAAGYRDGLRWTTNGHPLSAEEVQKVVSRVNQLSS